jgi:hypothetical protein
MIIFSNEQPGRLLAVFILAPIIAYKSYVYNDLFLLIFSIMLFIWDLYWLICKEPIQESIQESIQEPCE